ncbi:helix-turn-helix domain-containing protein [Natronobacterium texcoconense]|uniref:HTH DNA binding domain-containing protein n=1 Tax=Natronobacterium texcoconense TaxID=1095778 RepID=A0A1H0ZV34_NATTX|nr:helix-turn-helix domain-containing protein [Natronobacterium texcoconense]SDQ31324.1 HTH DNA binding domain-containing protein [Natronobacterium texcoconense]
MKRVRITIRPRDLDLPLAYEDATRNEDQFVSVRVVNWNITAPTAAFLLHVRGDLERFETLLERDPDVEEHELLSIADDECYCFVAGVGTTDARELWENFKRGSLMTVPPAEWNPDGSYTFTVVGRDEDIQTAVENVPAGASVDIDSVGGRRVAPDHVTDRLSDRQREAVRTAVELGHYEIPRRATTEDVARELECATSTAAEHLRKAEAKTLGTLFGE